MMTRGKRRPGTTVACALTLLAAIVAPALAFAPPARAADGGETIWTRTWGGESQDRFRFAEPCADGDVIVAGHVQTAIDRHIVVARYAPSGKRRWVRVVAAASTVRDSPSALAVDGSGNALVSGYREVGAGDFDAVVVKVGRTGVVAWLRQIDGGMTLADIAMDVAVDADGHAYVPCMTNTAAGQTATIFKLRAGSGATAWRRELAGEHTLIVPAAIAIDARRNTYVTGVGSAGANDEMVTVKLSSAGRVSWTVEAPGTGADQTGGELIALDPTGAVYVAGEIGAEAYVTDVLIVRYTKGGALSWRDEWDPSGTDTGRDQPKGLVVDRFGNAFVAGYFNEAGPNPANGFVARWRPDRTRWTFANHESDETDTGFDAVVPDDAGGCYVAGGVTVNYHDIGNEVEMGYLARYRGSGAIRWERAYACVGRRATFFGMTAWPRRGLCLVGDTRDWDNTEGEALVQLRRK